MSEILISDIFKQSKRTKHEIKGIEAKCDELAVVTEQGDGGAIKHTEDELKVLQEFDLCWQYGPCIGISRLDRWERAEKHGLRPPTHVKEILLRNNANFNHHSQCLWSKYNI